MLAKQPGLTLLVVATLAIGITSTTTVFSWIRSTLLTPIPGVSDSSSLWACTRGASPTPACSYLEYVQLRSQTTSFAGLLAYHDDWMTLTDGDKPQRVYGVLASANYFDLLRVRPVLGRGFLPEEEGKPGNAPVVVISHSFWQRHFAADPGVIGRQIELNRDSFTIVGVAPPGFHGCKTGLRSEIWIPLAMSKVVNGKDQLVDRDNYWFNVLGFLKPGESPQKAQQELNHLLQQMGDQNPRAAKDRSLLLLHPLWRSPVGANSLLYLLLPMLQGVAFVVLILACANVANLLLVRSITRRREISIRLSLGASRARLFRQLLVESLLLTSIAGVVALFLTYWTAGAFRRFIPPVSLPVSFEIEMDRTVFLVTFLVSALAGVVCGLVPAFRSTALSPVSALKEEAGNVAGGLHRSRLANTLVVVQVSLSMLLLVCAGLFVKSLDRAAQLNPGFDPEGVFLASLDLLPAGYRRDEGIRFFSQLLTRVEALPGVESVTLADSTPLSYSTHTSIIEAEGYVPQLRESMEVDRAYVGPNYLRTMRIPLVEGRDLTVSDQTGSPDVVVINEAFAARFFPGGKALGKRIRAEGHESTIVGIARNMRWANLQEPSRPFLFMPLFQNYYNEVTLHVRGSHLPQSLAGPIAKVVAELDSRVPLFDISRLDARIQVASFLLKMARSVVGVFGLLAWILSAVGLYAVVAYATRQRTREIGIRMALGSQRSRVFGLVVAQGLRLTLGGIAIGFLVSLAVTRFLGGQLLEVTPNDPLTYSAVACVLCVTALMACYLPAWRAARLEAAVALRCE